MVTVAWLNAKLQRAKTIPKIEKLTRDKASPPSFREVVEHIRSKPIAENTDK